MWVKKNRFPWENLANKFTNPTLKDSYSGENIYISLLHFRALGVTEYG